jgi:CRP/FNR family cyclic AMP-dependent transcriptional regulator
MLTEGKQPRINLLSELSSEEMQRVLASAVIESYDRREVIFLPGDDRTHVFLVIEGVVKLVRLSEDGREIIISTAEAGEIFGELALVNNGPHDTMAEMMSNGKIASIDVEVLEELLEEMPKLSLIIARVMGFRRMLLEAKLEDLAFRNVPARLAKFLLEEAASKGRGDGSRIVLPSYYSQQEIGSMIGSTRETTSHFLNDFRKSGLIDFNKRLISILNPQKLAELSGAMA